MKQHDENIIDIDVTQIPDYQRNELSKMAIALSEQLFSNPREEEEYQEWLRIRLPR